MPTFNAKVTSEKGHAILYLRKDNDDGTILLQIRNGEAQKTCTIVSGKKYWVEWHFWNDAAADYTLELNGPNTPPFPANQNYPYTAPHDDEGGFSFMA